MSVCFPLVAVVLIGISLFSPAFADDVAGTLQPARLRVEHLDEPVGIDVAQPRLSWEVTSPARGDRQVAYQVIVGDDRAAIAGGTGSLWDTGRVQSSETGDLAYAGKPLSAHQQLYWAVRVWDKDNGASTWSTPALFSTGFIGQSKWDAAWIGCDAPRVALHELDKPFADAAWIASAGDDVGRAAAGVRAYAGELVLPDDANVDAATVYVSADDRYRFAINGKEVGRSDGKDAWRTPQTIDIRSALRPGKNDVRARVENVAAGPTGLLANLAVRLSDGRVIRLATGDGWRATDHVADDWATAASVETDAPAKVLGKNGIEPWGTLGAHGVFLPPVSMLRKAFDVGRPVRRAVLYAAELGNADVYLNGARVTEDRFGSGWTDYAKRVYYRAYDVTNRLNIGSNAIGTLLADGWFSGYLGYSRSRDHYGKNARYSAELRIEYLDGTVESIKTDGSWRATASATLEADFLLGETYDARLAVPNWSAASFDDAAWAPVDVGTDEVRPLIQWHPAQPVRAYQTFSAATTRVPKPGVYVLDLGQNFAGVARLNVTDTKPGQKIVLRFAERLNPDGTIYTTNLRFARSTDTYICRGGASETWEPRFTFHGFQYVEITGLTAPPTADTVTGIALGSETPIVGEFETSDSMLNRLRANILYTQRSNFIDIPTDCPQRDERLGWTADAQVYLNAAILNADVQPFFTKWLVDLSDAQREDGQFPKTAPVKVGGDDGGPAWADAGVICPWDIYDAYGDTALLARQYPSMKRFVDYCQKRSGDDLLPPKQFHCFGDWLSINADTPKDVIYMAYFARSTKLTARAARVLGMDADADALDGLFERIKHSFHKAYVTPDGRIKGDTQTCYVLAIAYDLVDGADRAAAARHLVENIDRRDWHLSTGFLGTKELMLVLSEIGRTDVAFRLLHNDTFPSWGFSIKQGATSIWERWDGWTPENGFQDPGMNSFAHYSFGAVYQWMVENIGGIHASTGGARSVTIAPQLDPKLTWAKVGYHGPRGQIRSAWSIVDGRLNLDVTIPANVSATIVIPAAADADVTEGGVTLANAAGITIVERRRDAVVVSAGGGTYRFRSTISAAK